MALMAVLTVSFQKEPEFDYAEIRCMHHHLSVGSADSIAERHKPAHQRGDIYMGETLLIEIECIA